MQKWSCEKKKLKRYIKQFNAQKSNELRFTASSSTPSIFRPFSHIFLALSPAFSPPHKHDVKTAT